MKKITLSLCASILLLAACESKKEDIIQQKWQAIVLDNPDLQKIIDEQSAFLDTVGSHTTPEQNEEIYGMRNIDSAKQSLRRELEDYKAMQQHAVENTWFDFQKDGKMLMNFSGKIDSASWYFDEEGNLMIDEMKLKGAGSKIKMKVLTLQSDTLKLKFEEENMRSTVTFRPAKD